MYDCSSILNEFGVSLPIRFSATAKSRGAATFAASPATWLTNAPTPLRLGPGAWSPSGPFSAQQLAYSRTCGSPDHGYKTCPDTKWCVHPLLQQNKIPTWP